MQVIVELAFFSDQIFTEQSEEAENRRLLNGSKITMFTLFEWSSRRLFRFFSASFVIAWFSILIIMKQF